MNKIIKIFAFLPLAFLLNSCSNQKEVSRQEFIDSISNIEHHIYKSAVLKCSYSLSFVSTNEESSTKSDEFSVSFQADTIGNFVTPTEDFELPYLPTNEGINFIVNIFIHPADVNSDFAAFYNPGRDNHFYIEPFQIKGQTDSNLYKKTLSFEKYEDNIDSKFNSLCYVTDYSIRGSYKIESGVASFEINESFTYIN